jgi:hypothetical protein
MSLFGPLRKRQPNRKECDWRIILKMDLRIIDYEEGKWMTLA